MFPIFFFFFVNILVLLLLFCFLQLSSVSLLAALFLICLFFSSVFPEARRLCPPVQVDPSRYPEVGALYQHQAEAHSIRLTTLI